MTRVYTLTDQENNYTIDAMTVTSPNILAPVVEPDHSWEHGDTFVVTELSLEDVTRFGQYGWVKKAMDEAGVLGTVPASIRYVEGRAYYAGLPDEDLPKLRFMLNAPVFVTARRMARKDYPAESKRIIDTYGYSEESQQRMHAALDKTHFIRAFQRRDYARSIIEESVTTPGRRLSMLGRLSLL